MTSTHDDGDHDAAEAGTDRNEVHLVGKVSGAPDRRDLPSGDEVVTLRLVVARPTGGHDTVPVQVGPAPARGRRARADQIGRRVLQKAAAFADGDRIAVSGTLRRRWWAAGDLRRSRLEVAAARIDGVDTGQPPRG